MYICFVLMMWLAFQIRMGARSTKLHKGTSSLTLSTRDKYVSTLSLNMYASDWNLVVRDSFKPESVGLPSSAPQTKYIGPPSHLGKHKQPYPHFSISVFELFVDEINNTVCCLILKYSKSHLTVTIVTLFSSRKNIVKISSKITKWH